MAAWKTYVKEGKKRRMEAAGGGRRAWNSEQAPLPHNNAPTPTKTRLRVKSVEMTCWFSRPPSVFPILSICIYLISHLCIAVGW